MIIANMAAAMCTYLSKLSVLFFSAQVIITQKSVDLRLDSVAITVVMCQQMKMLSANLLITIITICRSCIVQ